MESSRLLQGHEQSPNQSPKSHERIAGPDQRGMQRLTGNGHNQNRPFTRHFWRPANLKQEKTHGSKGVAIA
jgi:hypothetical protein